jgi:hypothetical protein
MRRTQLGLLVALVTAGCGIAETKLPPEPTVEYLPCTGMELAGPRSDPLPILGELVTDVDEVWGGQWTVGEELHLGLTDVGTADWQLACPAIGDPELVVHEVPHPLGDLETWSRAVVGRIPPGDAGTVSQEIIVFNGQYVIEIRAETAEDALALTESVPPDAWAYGGRVSSANG